MKKKSRKNLVDGRKKKSPAKKSTPKDQTKPKGKFGEAFEKWKDGTPMSQLATSLGARRRELKKAFVKLAGSKDKFTALRDAGAGGKAFGGKRSGGGRTKAVIALDDSKVPVLESKKIPLKIHGAVLAQAKELKEALSPESVEKDHKLTDSEKKRMHTGFRNARRIVKYHETLKKHKGWTCEHYQSRYGTRVRLIAPDGKAYVRATDTERADYIVLTPVGRTRYKHEKEARVAKVDQQDSKLVAQGKKAMQHRKKVRKQKRNAKKSKAA